MKQNNLFNFTISREQLLNNSLQLIELESTTNVSPQKQTHIKPTATVKSLLNLSCSNHKQSKFEASSTSLL